LLLYRYFDYKLLTINHNTYNVSRERSTVYISVKNGHIDMEEESDPSTSEAVVNKIEDVVEESSTNVIEKVDLDQGEDSSLHVSNLTRWCIYN